MGKKHYLDRNEFHAELTICKRTGELSKKAIEMFTILATETSRRYFFKYEDDRQDAIQMAIIDCYKYWKNFKESNVVQLNIIRNFYDNEMVILDVKNYKVYSFTAKTSPSEPDEFKIENTPNKTLSRLSDLVDKNIIGVYQDKVKCKITFMDILNGDDLSIKSSLKLKLVDNSPITTNKKTQAGLQNQYDFDKPPNGFSYFTSVVNNAFIKSINKINPKQLRNGTVVSLSINQGSNGFFNIMLLMLFSVCNFLIN